MGLGDEQKNSETLESEGQPDAQALMLAASRAAQEAMMAAVRSARSTLEPPVIAADAQVQPPVEAMMQAVIKAACGGSDGTSALNGAVVEVPGVECSPLQSEASTLTLQPTDVAQETQVASHAAEIAHVQQQLYGLAKLAEESSSETASAAAFCAPASQGWMEVDQVKAVADAAAQAAQRAAWALAVVTSFVVPPEHEPELGTWVQTIRQMTQRAASSAEQSAQECYNSANSMPASAGAMKPPGARIPCKFFGNGHCYKGTRCQFSHDAEDFKARPLVLKHDDRECSFYPQGKCVRGATCLWAHSAEELAEIRRLRGMCRAGQRWL